MHQIQNVTWTFSTGEHQGNTIDEIIKITDWNHQNHMHENFQKDM
jgi:hypothetical protein